MPQKDSKPKISLAQKIEISRLKRKILKHTKAIRVALILLTLGLIFLATYTLINYILNQTFLASYVDMAKTFINPQAAPLQTSNTRTNILILGKGGEGHTAPDLTDTIIFFSISPQNNRAVFISLPRDIWIPELRTKLNSIYYWGNQDREGGGLQLAKSTVSSILNQPI